MTMPSLPVSSAEFTPVSLNGLPIYRKDKFAYSIFYTPGYLVVADRQTVPQFAATLQDADGSGAMLQQKAKTAVQAREYQFQSPFSPECLTLYLHNRCNLHCRYCFSAASLERSKYLDMATIHAAAQSVAASCYQKGRVFAIALHGGGEPTLDQSFAESVLAILDQVANTYNVPIFRYVATNGVMSEEKARWLAHRFDLVGLSCDGPPDIQNVQRPLWDARPTAGNVERTAHILNAEGRPFHVRVTLTQLNVARQSEIVDYLCRQLAPAEIHMEPVYLGGRANSASAIELNDAALFVDNFISAQRLAKQYGVPLIFAGSRLNSIHGAYCNIFRNVLNVVPGDVATACFKTVDGEQAQARGMTIGAIDRQMGQFIIHHDKIDALRAQGSMLPTKCQSCFNQYHCARNCPDTCDDGTSSAPTFRCSAQKMIATARLEEIAKHLWSTATNPLGMNEIGNIYASAIV